jgi:hypothetical protein
MAYLAGWGYYAAVAIDNTANTSNLSYYQLPVTISGALYACWAVHGKSDGSDLRVTDSDGTTPLSFALEGIDAARQALYLLVKVPAVAAGGSKTIYVYWGNASASSVSSYPGTVQNNNAITGPNDIFTQSSHVGYNAEPGLILLSKQTGAQSSHNGDLFASFDAMDNNSQSHNGDVWVIRSTDGGTTWTPTQLVTHSGANGFMVYGLLEYVDGSIYMIYSYGTNTQNQSAYQPLYCAKSMDSGLTWANLSTTPSNKLATPWTQGTQGGIPYGRMFLDAANNIYIPCHWNQGQTFGRCGILTCPARSDPTNGSNWSLYSTVNNDQIHELNETAVCIVTSSNWIAISRNDTPSGDGDLYLTRSSNGGLSWGTPARMNIYGTTSTSGVNAVAPDLLKLASGNILLGFGIRYGSTWGIGYLLSKDGGNTFDETPQVQPAMYGMTYTHDDYGYSSTVQLANGKILSIAAHGTQASGGGFDYANVYSVLFDEDYVVNGTNQYDGCESFGSLWAHGAQGTIDSTHIHGGTSAIKIDNSVGTGDWALWTGWPSGNNNRGNKVAFSFWMYTTQASTTTNVWQINDGTGTAPNGNAQVIVGQAVSPYHIQWYNGTAYQDTGVVMPLNSWQKNTVRANVRASAVSGQLHLNNVSVTTALGKAANGTGPAKIEWGGASFGSTHNNTFWIDDVYTHQFTPTVPAVTAGSEQTTFHNTAGLKKDAIVAVWARRRRGPSQ